MITDRIGLLSVLLPLLTARAARIFCMFLGLHPWDLLIIPKCALVHTAFDVYYLITVSTKNGRMMQVKKKNPQVMKRWRQSHLVKSTSLKVISTRCAHESDLVSREFLGLEVTIDLAL